MARIYKSPWDPVPLHPGSAFDFLWQNPEGVSCGKPAFINGLTGEIVTRKQLRTDSQRLGYALTHQFGLKPGDVVGVLFAKYTSLPRRELVCTLIGSSTDG